MHSASTALSTSTLVNETAPAVESTETLNTTENWEVAKSCVTTYTARPDGYELTGVAVLRSLSSTTLGLNLSLLDLENNTSKEIPTPNPVDLADVSPDGKTLGYVWFNNATSKWELTLLDATGNHPEVAYSSKEFVGFYGFLNDHQVVIEEDNTYIIVDPYKDSQEKIFPFDFPDFDNYSPIHFFVSFNSVLTRAVYKNGDVILLDLTTNTVLARIKDSYYDRSPIIAWDSSGERIAVVATSISAENVSGFTQPDEIFIADQHGQSQQLTHLYENFGLISTIESLSWAPNGQNIAFWLNDKEGNLILMVADSITGKVVNYCILNVIADLFPMYLPAPIWSPDGGKLLVESRYAKDKSSLLIVDLDSNIAFPIAENQNPIGWMVKP